MFDDVKPVDPGVYASLTQALIGNLGKPHPCDRVGQWIRKLNPIIVQNMLRVDYTGYIRVLIEGDEADDLERDLADEIAEVLKGVGWDVTVVHNEDERRVEYTLIAI